MKPQCMSKNHIRDLVWKVLNLDQLGFLHSTHGTWVSAFRPQNATVAKNGTYVLVLSSTTLSHLSQPSQWSNPQIDKVQHPLTVTIL